MKKAKKPRSIRDRPGGARGLEEIFLRKTVNFYRCRDLAMRPTGHFLQELIENDLYSRQPANPLIWLEKKFCKSLYETVFLFQ